MDNELPDGTLIDTTYGVFTYLQSGDSLYLDAYHETRSVAVDGMGNTIDASDILGNYLTPPSWGRIAFDPGVWLKKRSPSGNVLWKRYFKGQGHPIPWGLEVDQEDNIYLCGEYSTFLEVNTDTLNQDTIFSAGGFNPNGFILKIDPLGNTTLALNFECSGELNCYDIKIDAFQNIYVVGSFEGTADFDPGIDKVNASTPSTTLNLFVVKLDSAGNYLWHHNAQSTELSRAYKCEIDLEGGIYVTGEFSGISDFSGTGSDPRTASNWEGFIFKLDSSGAYQWARDYGRVVRATHFDGTNLVVSGKFSDSLNIDPGSTNQYIYTTFSEDAFLQKISPDGAHLWGTEIGTGLVDIRAISSNDMGELLVAGGLRSPSIFNINGIQDTLTNNELDLFVGIYDSLNNLRWVHSWSSPENDWLNDAKFIDNQNFIVGGTFSDALYLNDDDMLIYGEGQFYDGLTFRASKCVEIIDISPKECTEYNSPSGKYIWNATGTYYDSTYISGSCDTVYAVSLTIQAPNTDVNISGDSLIAVQSGASYKWLNCDSSFQVIAGAERQYFIPTWIGNFAVEINNEGCIDTSACFNSIISGVDDFIFDNEFDIYPNPTSGTLTISFDRPIDNTYSISIHNALGQTIYSFKPIRQRSDIDVIRLESGVYLIQLRNANGIEVYKVIKE